jgi:hypothetical protein
MSLPQPPEGILDPKLPWFPGKVGEKTWVILKARLTGGEAFGTGYSSFVNLTSADADKLIENLKKDPRGYPQFNQTGGALEYENLQKYQEWLREDYLEKPFNKERDAKIEEAAIESRMREIDAERQQNKIKELEEQAKKDKESIPLPPIQEEKKEQDILDSDQEAIEEQVEEITTGLDSVQEEEKKAETPKQTPEQDSSKLDSDIQAISDSLLTIKGSLSNQISDLGSIERDSIKSLSALEGLKQLFQTQTDIIKREVETSKSKQAEDSLEKSNVVSGTDEATSTTADNKAEGIIQGVDGPTITVKTTEGEFRQGQKISQGGGGGGLFDMLKGIAGKFMGGGKGGGGGAGGGSPLKMSRGGIAVGPTKLAGGAFSPGIYSKPTRGNLGPGQAVVPLNRNIGKKMFPDQLKQTIKLQQPLADVMAQPLKAIGLSILAVAGNFLRLLGPLAGFFTPYVSGLVKGFAGVLGVPVAIVGALLGGPAYAAMEDQERQQNVFAELWASLMEKFGFSSSDDEKKGKKKKKREGDTPSTATGKWGPLLDVIASGEGNYDSLNPSLKRPEIVDMTISELVAFQHESKAKHGGTAAAGRYQMLHPENYARKAGLSMDEKFSPENQDKMAANYIENIRGGKDWLAGKLTDENFGKELAKEWAALEYPGKGGGFYDGDGRNNAKVSWEKVKSVLPKVKAESGTTTSDSSMGKMLGWSVVKGPNSGYYVDPNLEMHGEEAYLQYEKGFKVLPIENNEFSLSKNPKETLTRWQELMNPNRTSLEDKRSTSAAKGVTKRETLVGRIFNFAKKDFMNAFASNKPSKPQMANLGAGYKSSELLASAAARASQVGTGRTGAGGVSMGGGNAGASARRPARSPIGNPPPKNTPEIKKVPSETDVMMEQYEALAAAGKHSEAKELGMKIWNKTWRKTEKGIERIPTTPITATNATLPTASASSPTAVSSPQQIIVPIPASGGGAPAIVPLRTMKEEMELITLKNLC